MGPKQEGLVVNSGCPGLRKEAKHPPGIELHHLGQENCRERGTEEKFPKDHEGRPARQAQSHTSQGEYPVSHLSSLLPPHPRQGATQELAGSGEASPGTIFLPGLRLCLQRKVTIRQLTNRSGNSGGRWHAEGNYGQWECWRVG